MRRKPTRFILTFLCLLIILATVIRLTSTNTTPQWLYPTNHHRIDDTSTLLLLKSGCKVIHQRIPAHLSVIQSLEIPNYIIYSDLVENLAVAATSQHKAVQFTTVDILANVSTKLSRSDQFTTYHIQRNLQRDGISISRADVQGGWTLDKFKFLPMFAHAYRTHPDMKWYIFIEADSFIFWHHVHKWLATLDHTKPYYFGSLNAMSDDTRIEDVQMPDGNVKHKPQFAHGGSGIVFSQAALKKSYGENPGLEHMYDQKSIDLCCGDALLGDALRDHGVRLSLQAEGSRMRFQGEPTWRIAINGGNWCEPLLTLHHVSQQEVLALHEFQMQWKKDDYIRYRDIYYTFLSPNLHPFKSDWDNLSESRAININNTNLTPSPSLFDQQIACANECQNWSYCLQWKLVQADGICYLSDTIKLGMAGRVVSSGWHLDRIRKAVEPMSCDALRDA